jgi:RecQ-mediated genome instability protein 1
MMLEFHVRSRGHILERATTSFYASRLPHFSVTKPPYQSTHTSENSIDTGMAANIAAELTQHLNARHLYPTAAWLQSFLSTTRPNTPLPAIKQTAHFRLLATDITTSLKQPAASVFPPDILKGTTPSRVVAGPVVCQVLDIEDIGHSRWSQVESIEARERGEMTKGREIVRVVEQENEGTAEAAAPVLSKGPFKLLLQDAKGLKIYAFDLRAIDGVNTSMSMGVKIVLRNVDVRRGVVMLEPGNVQVVGGKLEALDKAWKEGRKERLMAAARVGQTAG